MNYWCRIELELRAAVRVPVRRSQAVSYLLKDFDRVVEFGGSKKVVVTVHLGDSGPSFGNGLEGGIKLPGSGIT